MPSAVLLIRAHDQANALEQALAGRGQAVYRHAVIETQPLALHDADLNLLEQHYDGVIVVSPAAVRFCAEALNQHQRQWPDTTYYTVGSGTAEALVTACHKTVTYPAPEHHGEALLALEELQAVDGTRWLIITGQQGRTVLADTLAQRGARVDTLEVYQRVPLVHDFDAEAATDLANWQQNVGTIVVTSEQQLTLFWESLPQSAHTWARQVRWVVSSQYLHDILSGHGVAEPQLTVADNATTAALLRAVPQPAPDHAKPTPDSSSAEAEQPAKPTHTGKRKKQTETITMSQPSPTKRSRFAIMFSTLLLICLITLGAGSYWVWAQQETFRQQTIAQLTELNQRIETSERQQESVQGEIWEQLETQLASRLTTLQQEQDEAFRQQYTQAAEERAAIRDEFDQQTAELERVRTELDASNLRVSQELYLVEARDLTIAAGRKLWLEFDRETAILLLQRAGQLLADAGHSHLLPIRQQLQNDIELLQSVDDVDLESVALRLGAIRRQLSSLPFPNQNFGDREQAGDDDAVSSSFADWRSNLATAWNNFSDDFIRIQRSGELPELQLGQEQQILLISQLELQLQIAQQATLQRQTITYRDGLTQAVEWLETYFDTEQERVQRVLAELRELSELDLDPTYPTRLLSEAMLRDIVDEMLEGLNP